MSVRLIEEIISATSGEVFSAGTCGIVKEHIIEGKKYDNEGTVFLKVDWEGHVGTWRMLTLDDIVIHEHSL